MREREYIAFTDNGHDYAEFTFYSEHRAGSKANMEDANRTMRRRFGKTESRNRNITSVMLK